MSQQEVDAWQVRKELTLGVSEMQRIVLQFERDPAHVLAQLAWLGLALAERTQELSSGVQTVEGAEMPPESKRFFSMDGALTAWNGSLVQVDEWRFPKLWQAFEKSRQPRS